MMRLDPEPYLVIREMENGDVVVDYGRSWFVCKKDGHVTAKIVKFNGAITTRPATPTERMIALGHAAFDKERTVLSLPTEIKNESS